MTYYSTAKQKALPTFGSSKPHRKQPMKTNRFKNWVRNWLNDYDERNQPIAMVETTERIQSDGLKFQLYKANGGYVVETTRLDRPKDRVHHQIYIITNDADIGQEISKIITLEQLRS